MTSAFCHIGVPYSETRYGAIREIWGAFNVHVDTERSPFKDSALFLTYDPPKKFVPQNQWIQDIQIRELQLLFPTFKWHEKG
jgi:hypothetical protein